jgi:hypothetical protein
MASGGVAQVEAAPFVGKTYRMVDDPATDGVVAWGADNSSFVVANPFVFSQTLAFLLKVAGDPQVLRRLLLRARARRGGHQAASAAPRPRRVLLRGRRVPVGRILTPLLVKTFNFSPSVRPSGRAKAPVAE